MIVSAKRTLLSFLALILVTLPALAADPNNITGTAGLVMIDKRGGLVRFFDPSTLAEIATLELTGPPHELAISLLVIDPETRKIEAAIDTDGTGLWAAVLPDGSKAYVANKDDRKFVSVIDLKKREMIGKIPMPNGTQGITVSPDGKRVIAIDFSEPRFVVVDTATDEIVDTVALAGNSVGPFRARYSPDGGTLITVNHIDSLANIFDGRDLDKKQATLQVGAQAFGIAYAPDGKTALVSNHGDGTISVLDFEQDRVVKTFAAGTGIETLSYY